eukprot:SM000264S09754  [mRNA]  locus=s264:49863:52676:+ [translate_table: standard]
MTDQADVCQICKELQSSHPLFQGQRVPGLQLVFSDAQLLEYLADSPSIHHRGSVLSLLIPFKNVYKCPPWLLPAKDCRGDHPFYYFSPSPTSKWHNSSGRANDSDRSAGGGRWKNTGGTPAKVQSAGVTGTRRTYKYLLEGLLVEGLAQSDHSMHAWMAYDWTMYEYELTSKYMQGRQSASHGADVILYKLCAKKVQPSLDKWQARSTNDRALGSISTSSKHLAKAQGEDRVSGKRGPDGKWKGRPLQAYSDAQRAYSDAQRAYSDAQRANYNAWAESCLLDEEMPEYQYLDLGREASPPTKSQTTPIGVSREEEVKEGAANNTHHTWPTASTASFSTEEQSIREDLAARLLEMTPGVKFAPQDASRDLEEGGEMDVGGEEYGNEEWDANLSTAYFDLDQYLA